MSIANSIIKYRQTWWGEFGGCHKTKPNEAVQEAYDAGQETLRTNPRDGGKIPGLAKVSWHMIGHVQTNKIKYMAPFVHMVHSVDRKKVLVELNKQAAKNDRVIGCLLQVHIARAD